MAFIHLSIRNILVIEKNLPGLRFPPLGGDSLSQRAIASAAA